MLSIGRPGLAREDLGREPTLSEQAGARALGALDVTGVPWLLEAATKHDGVSGVELSSYAAGVRAAHGVTGLLTATLVVKGLERVGALVARTRAEVLHQARVRDLEFRRQFIEQVEVTYGLGEVRISTTLNGRSPVPVLWDLAATARRSLAEMDRIQPGRQTTDPVIRLRVTRQELAEIIERSGGGYQVWWPPSPPFPTPRR